MDEVKSRLVLESDLRLVTALLDIQTRGNKWHERLFLAMWITFGLNVALLSVLIYDHGQMVRDLRTCVERR